MVLRDILHRTRAMIVRNGSRRMLGQALLKHCVRSATVSSFRTLSPLLKHITIPSHTTSKLQHHLHPSELSFEQEYTIRSSLERLINDYSKRDVPQITLKHLVTLAKEDPKVNSKITINYLTIFNARRLQAFRELPYLVVLNPHIAEIYNLYLESLQLLLNLSRNEDQEEIYNTLLRFFNLHRDTIPTLSRGFQEVSAFYPKEDIVKFLNKHFKDRINMETVTTNYIQSIERPDNHVGIINKKLNIADLIQIYAGFVNDMTFIKYYKQVPIAIDFGKDIEFPYIGNHLEYIITEILKNSIRAHIESNNADTPILVTIVESKKDDKQILGIRFRDEGGGIPLEIVDKIFDYSFTSVKELAKNDENMSMAQNLNGGEEVHNVAGMGYGLPLTKIYVEQFGGRLELQNCFGLGTDVYVELTGPDENLLK